MPSIDKTFSFCCPISFQHFLRGSHIGDVQYCCDQSYHYPVQGMPSGGPGVTPKGMVFELLDFAHYGLKSGMGFKGTTRAYKRICLFNSK